VGDPGLFISMFKFGLKLPMVSMGRSVQWWFVIRRHDRPFNIDSDAMFVVVRKYWLKDSID